MKTIKISNKLIILLALVFVSGFYSCETTNLDLQNDPNNLTPDSADPNFILNGIQFTFANQHLNLSSISSGVVRHTNQFGTYGASAVSGTMNGAWASTYSITNNLKLLKTLDVDGTLNNEIAIGEILEAYAYVNLVDYIGTAVYSEAANPLIEFPNLDTGESIYDAMYVQLDEAISKINVSGTVNEDLYYNGDLNKWVKLANTLKIKMYVQTKLTNNTSAASEINSIIASGNYINTEDDDFVYRFGTSATNPDTRSPFFQAAYITGAGGTYMSNDFMNKLLNGKSIEDPRLKYYIYRQTLSNPTADLLPCDGDADYQYCYIGNGYWGRDHADNEGIPNDNEFRSTYGAYPGGGALDVNTVLSLSQRGADEYAAFPPITDPDFPVNPDTELPYTEAEWIDKVVNDSYPARFAENLGGAGIHPMLLSSFTNFLLAEAALPGSAGLGTTGSPETYLRAGMEESFSKVATYAGAPMDAATVTTYVDEVIANFNAAASDSDKLNIIITEYHLAAWGNSIESYNNYRRTGFPDLGFSVISNTTFPRSYFIPSSEIDSNDNPNLTQKTLTDQLFWDTNAPGFIN
jgi:hypothetical protein